MGQFLAIHICQNLDAFQFQIVHDVVEFLDGDFRLLQCDHAKPDEPVGFARAILRYTIIGEAMGRGCDFRIDRIITLAGAGATT